MRVIDMESWPRRTHFELFTGWDYPHFGLCAEVDLTAFYPFVKENGLTFNTAFIYVIARAANEIPEFRQRIRGNSVVEHALVHPASTILVDDDLFSFCQFAYVEDYAVFAADAARIIALVKEKLVLEDAPGRDDLLFLTAIPWVSFSGVQHPIHMSPVDSIPRIAWGKFFQDGDKWKMPLGVQAHHALVDGLHVGRFYTAVQRLLDEPRAVFSERLSF